ncbi:hypothetical protein [Pulveribacter sp.]|uniref:hypothetical protein n=1 Tax=Pulveribacter sp. TaxID=2678893 RepID=UPI0028A7B63D|nr:hypothetical protein [Pulveribacter sp.]
MGFIPVGDGMGWDGGAYLGYIMKLTLGDHIHGDPYRLIRISGFLPSVLMARLSVEPLGIIFFQMVVNVIILSAAAALFFRVIKYLINNSLKAVVLTGCLFFSWPYLVLPVYYPILSDHLALALTIFAIWAWVESRFTILLVLIFYACWVMPGLFFVPLVLAVMPFNEPIRPLCNEGVRKYFSVFAFAGAACAGYYFLSSIAALTDDEIIGRPMGVAVGFPELRYWTLLALALCFVCVAYIFSRVFAPVLSVIGGVNIKRGALALGVLLVGFFSIRTLIDWDHGFQGPPLFYFLRMQASSAPLKPLVAHFLYFGPVFILALMSLIFAGRNFERDRSFPLFLILAAYLPVLIVGSESRQWIAAFPVAVALVAMSNFNIRTLLLFLFFALALCVPAIYLRDGVNAAFSSGAQDYFSTGWQLYFGRQGPWTSRNTYVIGLVSIFVFFMAYACIPKCKDK